MRFLFRRGRGGTRRDVLQRLEREVREEIRFYLEERVRGMEARGIETEEAWRRALKAFGDPEEVISESTAVRSGNDAGNDLRKLRRPACKRLLGSPKVATRLGI